jgi:hypothetical protein
MRKLLQSDAQQTGRHPTSQHDRFVETARALGCDESEAAFDEKLRQIARYKPAPKAPKRKPAPKS